MTLFAVLTTIQAPTPAVRALQERLHQIGGNLIVAGDRKGPVAWELPDSTFLDLAAQQASGFALAAHLPTGHYARKNIGYLEAMRQGAPCIYETDDDNAPLAGWSPRAEQVEDARAVGGTGWVNVYRYFTDAPRIWPRGFPLQALGQAMDDAERVVSVQAPVQQGLVNGSPDVDAIWRLTQDRVLAFENRASVWLAPGQWCPFNTQSTWWWPLAYPLLYVPSHCSFRMCDIWKSFVAQRCLWAMDKGVAFHAPEVVQARNEHNLMKDFEDEVPGYLLNARIAGLLEEVDLVAGPEAVGDNLHRCYEKLIAAAIFPKSERQLVESWLTDVAATSNPRHHEP
jgi:hypothetical protein